MLGKELPDFVGGVERGGGWVQAGNAAVHRAAGGAGPLVAGAGDGDEFDGAVVRAGGQGGGDRAGGGDGGLRALVGRPPPGVEVRDGRAVDVRDALAGAAVVGDVLVGGAVEVEHGQGRGVGAVAE